MTKTTVKNLSMPCVTLIDFDDNARVIPLDDINAIIAGKKSITELEDYDKIVPIILMEWLQGCN